jgi:hypothetical protein
MAACGLRVIRKASRCGLHTVPARPIKKPMRGIDEPRTTASFPRSDGAAARLARRRNVAY